MDPAITIALITGVLGFLGIITKTLMDRNTEHRLTVLEENRLSGEDLQCIKETIVLIRLWFRIYEEELPKALKNPPGISAILDKITGNLSAFTSLSPIDQGKLVEYLEMKSGAEDPEIRWKAKFYLGMIKLRVDESWRKQPLSELGVC